jgi:hypothetical protein
VREGPGRREAGGWRERRGGGSGSGNCPNLQPSEIDRARSAVRSGTARCTPWERGWQKGKRGCGERGGGAGGDLVLAIILIYRRPKLAGVAELFAMVQPVARRGVDPQFREAAGEGLNYELLVAHYVFKVRFVGPIEAV